jgi:hypothetical protein
LFEVVGEADGVGVPFTEARRNETLAREVVAVGVGVGVAVLGVAVLGAGFVTIALELLAPITVLVGVDGKSAPIGATKTW